MPRIDPERRDAAVCRLRQLRDSGALSMGHVRMAAAGLGVSVRTIWRWTASDGVTASGRPGYRLSETDREAYTFFRGNVSAVHRAHAAVASGASHAAGVLIPEFLRLGWAGSGAAGLRTLQRAFACQFTPAERAAWSEGERARRSVDVYLRRPASYRNQVWEADHKQLPILVLAAARRGCSAMADQHRR